MLTLQHRVTNESMEINGRRMPTCKIQRVNQDNNAKHACQQEQL